jgi:CRP-like cAMP-binding protein
VVTRVCGTVGGMTALAEVKSHAMRLFAKGDALSALRLFDAIVAAAPLDYEARVKVGDCLAALGHKPQAAEVMRAVGWYALKSGHPLVALVVARVIESYGAEADDLLAALVVRYGSESELIGKFAARINLPPGTTEVMPPNLHAPAPPDLVEKAAVRARTSTDNFQEFPAAVHSIPLLSDLSEAAFRRLLGTLVVRRMPDKALVIREGEPGQSFFFVASGQVRVYDTDGTGKQKDLAKLHENAIFGEMALLSARPRSASVEVVGEADLLEVTRESLAGLAGELEQVAAALSEFTRDRLLSNLMATSPLFRPISRTQQRDLQRRFTSHDVAPGTAIIRQGDEGRGLFLVLSGDVEVVSTAPDGSPVPLSTLRAGDVFGEMSLIRGGPTSATVMAASSATVLFLAREYVDRIVHGVPEIRKYLETLTEDRELDQQLAMQPDELGEDDVIIMI